MQPPLPPPAGYQGSFHSIQNCFPYGDCYRSAEQATSGDGLAGEAHGFNPLRPNGYHSLTAPLPATGKPRLHASFPFLCRVLRAYCPTALGRPHEVGSSPLYRGGAKGAGRSQDPTEWGFARCLTPASVFLPHSHTEKNQTRSSPSS